MNSVSALEAEPPRIRLAARITPLGLCVAMMLLAFAVRALALDARPLWLDEAFSAWFSERSWTYLWSVVPTFEAHPPFYYSLLKLWSGWFGGGLIALRGLSMVLSVLTIPLVMAIASEQEQQHPTGRPLVLAGTAAFLVACSPLLVVIGQEARPYPLLTFAYALAILGLFRLARQFRDGGAGTGPSWALFALGTELTLWAHALGLLYGLCLAFALAPAWLARPVCPQRLLRGIAAGTVAALLYLPCLLMILGRARDWRTNWLQWQPDMLLQLVGLYSVPAGQLTIGAAAGTLVMLLLIKRALQSAWSARGWNSERAMLLLWLGPPLLSALVSAVSVPVFLARTLAATLVPAYLAIAGALARTRSPRERAILGAVLVATLVPVAVQTALRSPSESWDQVSAFLRRNVAPGDQVWLYPGDSALPLAQADPAAPPMRALPAPFPTLGVAGPIRAGWPAMVSLTPRQAAAVANDPGIAQVPTIWLVTRQSGIFDPADDLPSALGRVRRRGAVREWGYIGVRPYYASRTPR
jgi:mannosyltransferase